MRMVVAVIGHVDHDKTALVRAPTGMETERLAEEQRRGISISLGFAHLTVQGTTIDLIDMPGHERFVRTMVSGATGVDAALLPWVGREVPFHHKAIEGAKCRLAPLLTGGSGMLVGEVGAALGISRKYCVPLLKPLDAIRFTRRIADRRVLASA